MNNLTRFDRDDIEIFIDAEGKSFASIRGVARMAGKDEKQIRRFITADNISVIKAKILTATGLKTAALLAEDDIVTILAEYNLERLKEFARVGVRLALHQIAGYESKLHQPKQFDVKDLSDPQLRCIARSISQPELRGLLLKSVPAIFHDMPGDVCLALAAQLRIELIELFAEADVRGYTDIFRANVDQPRVTAADKKAFAAWTKEQFGREIEGEDSLEKALKAKILELRFTADQEIFQVRDICLTVGAIAMVEDYQQSIYENQLAGV